MKKIMKEMFKKVCEEELDRLKKVEQQLDELQDKCHFEPQTVEGEKTYVHIEHVKVDKIEYNIDFEQLSIEELSGMLNIGATYHTPAHRLKQACAEESRDNPQNDAAKEKRQTKQQTPNVTIRGRKH
ncbi:MULTISPECIES: spore germination protein GerPC [Bacillus]|uniref:spore germination protein GerPC n=1 Tax=Bacillus TaxID=1386 RepID=UPI0003D68A75|nr:MULTISPECIES: spore germination protein GerPC [Bacillus]AHC42484.1 hypothetical protein U722_10355 [Bacillus amyloliquefaciens LFB112]MBB4873703.1 hypothetical protein [Bacillus velezensis]MBE1279740.1 hypothetical protein [Bacillus sp. Bvel1]MBW8600554.1 spore germination protein GerPC [Bacillus amyloliquefaciens]MDY7903965.1 spore germination protein GerPC [Bacillus sp. AG1]